MKQGQDLGRAAADVFMRLGGRVLARLPGYAGMRHGLKRPRLVLAPDRQPQLGAEHVGSLDQPLFTAASGSLTRTTPCLRVRITTPVSHQVRPFCQLSTTVASMLPVWSSPGRVWEGRSVDVCYGLVGLV